MALLAGGATLGRAVVVLATPLLTRLYSPDDFGLLAVFGALLGILGALACLRYELAIPLPGRARTAASLLILCFILVGVLCLLSLLVVSLLAEPLAALLNVPALAEYLWLLPIGLLGIGCYQALSYWVVRRKAFGRLARTRVAQGIGQVVVQLGWGASIGGPAGLLAGAIVGRAAGVTTLAAELRRDRHLFRTVSLRSLRWVMRRYRRFPTLATGSALLSSSARQLPAILLAVLYGPQVVGWYALGQRILGAPMMLVGGAVAQVYIGEMPRLLRDDPVRLRSLFLRLTWRLLSVSLPALGVIGLAGEMIFRIVFGEEWGQAGLLAQVLVLNYFGQFVVAPTSQTLHALERQDLHLVLHAVQLCMILFIFWIGDAFDWPPLTLVAVYSVAMLAAYAAQFTVTWLLIKRRVVAAVARRSEPRGSL